MRVAIVTDAWKPQVNGVVTTLGKTVDNLRIMGHQVVVINPESFKTIPCPSYPSIRLALMPRRKLGQLLDEFVPEAIHISTEGPLGLAARRYCLRHKLRFTTAYHTQFPEYLRLRAPIPLSLGYRFMRWFHGPAERTMVPTQTQIDKLAGWGMKHLALWSRGVDISLFTPNKPKPLESNGSIAMYMGRVAVEKNIEAFLNLEISATKYVVGDGPDMAVLQRKYPEVKFVGFKFGEELASYLAAADVFVFPSKTDTFGLVLLEAMACGVPVAAYPVTGPLDVVTHGVTGYLCEDLQRAVNEAIKLDGKHCREYAESQSWMTSTEQFANHLVFNQRDEQAELEVVG